MIGTRRPGRTATAFLVLGIVFLTLGVTTNRSFLAAGVAFLVIGLVQRARDRRDPPAGEPPGSG